MNKKLGFKILVTVLGITIFSAFSSGIYQYIFQIRESNKEISEKLLFTSEQMSRLLQTSVYLYDYITAKSICTASFSDQNIFSIRIMNTGFDEMNFTLTKSDIRDIPEEVLTNIKKNLVFIDQDIFFEEEYIGTLEIGMTKYFLIQEVKHQIGNIVILLFVNCIILILFLFLFLERIFVTPLFQITRVAEMIADGAFSSRISIKNNDELGILAQTINIMAQTIDENITVLKNEIENRKEVERKLQKNMDEKNVLIMEIHHRVKNNLAIINSIMNLQAEKFENYEIRNAINESRSIIYSIALVHEQLYKSNDLSQINMREYISELAEHLKNNYFDFQNINIQTDIDYINLDINQSTPLGILLNELITNAFKHAYMEDQNLDLWILLKKVPANIKTVCLTVKDNGRGFPSDMDIKNTNTLGLTLVYSLANQLHAEINISKNKPSGTIISITFQIK